MSSSVVRSFLTVTFIFVAALAVSGCHEGVERRPPGYIRLGPIKDFLTPETFLKVDRILVRHDDGGFSAMSTLCTHDLSPLQPKMKDGQRIWVSEYSASTYADDGTVLTLPAKAPLPYFRLEFASAKYGGPVDTLYVYVGDDRPKDWRLAIPK